MIIYTLYIYIYIYIWQKVISFKFSAILPGFSYFLSIQLLQGVSFVHPDKYITYMYIHHSPYTPKACFGQGVRGPWHEQDHRKLLTKFLMGPDPYNPHMDTTTVSGHYVLRQSSFSTWQSNDSWLAMGNAVSSASAMIDCRSVQLVSSWKDWTLRHRLRHKRLRFACKT